MAGCILAVMGLARLGSVIKFIPSPVIVGFTAGIAVIIWTGQWKDFFGLHPAPSGLHFHEKIFAVLRAFPDVHVATTLIAALTLAVVDKWSLVRARAGHEAGAGAAGGDAGRDGRAGDLALPRRRDHRQRIRRHPTRAAWFLVAGAGGLGPEMSAWCSPR